MIKIGNREVEVIKLGNSLPPSIKLGNVIVWPSSFFYTLELKAVEYSSGSQLLATAANNCKFICDYVKYRTVDSGRVDTVYNVVATPSPTDTYFTASSDKTISFNKGTYGTTPVNQGSNYSVTLTYEQAILTGATFSFEGNARKEYQTTVTTPVTLSSQSPVSPSGTTSLTYSGGYGKAYWIWKSGAEEVTFNGRVEFNPAYNSDDTGRTWDTAYVTTVNNRITIPSLATHKTTAETTYRFTGVIITGCTFVVGQKKNEIVSSPTSYKYYKGGTVTEIYGDYTIQGEDDGSFDFYIKQTSHDEYESGAHSPDVTTDMSNTSWTASTDASSDFVHSIVNSGSINKRVNYRGNIDSTNRRCNINVQTGVTTWTAFELVQCGATITYKLVANGTSYNDGGSQLLANASNYCQFPCLYKKMRGQTEITSTPVTGTPTAIEAFVVSETQLKFNKDSSYGTTSVSSGSRNVTVKYVPSGSPSAETTGSFVFQGNSSTTMYRTNPDNSTYPTKIRPLNAETFSTVGASGVTMSYRGGYFTEYQHWTSGKDSNEVENRSLQFDPAANSSITGKTGSVSDGSREIRIPNLGTTTGNSGSYSFYCVYPTPGFVSNLVIYQNGNSYHIETDKQLKDSGGNVISGTYNIPCTSGSFKFYLEETNTYVYDSGSRDTKSAQKVVNTNLTAVTTGDEGVVSNITRDGDGYNMVVYYNANTQTYPKEEERIIVKRSNSYSVGFRLIQAASEITYHYTLTTSVGYTNGNAVRATGTDYAIITCNYNKVRDDTSAIVETIDVSTSASITAPYYFTKRSGYNNQIGYNKSSYGTTEVTAGNKGVSVSYANSSVTQNFYFSGNTATTQNVITQPISLNATTASAAGREISFTGGKGRIDSVWSSGERSTGSEIYLEYNEPFNSSSDERAQGYVINDSTGHKVVIPSLNKLEITSGTYNFSSTTITGSTFVITQSANTVSSSTYYDIYCSATTYDQEEKSVTVGSSAGSVTFRVRQKTVKRYSSGAETIVSESDVANNSYNVQIDIITGGDEFITYTKVSTYDVRINYTRNTSGDRSNEASIVIGGNVVVGFLVNQE